MLSQWYFKITAFADVRLTAPRSLPQDLLQGLDTLPEWPAQVKQSQRNWIGRQEGAQVAFRLAGRQGGSVLEVFSTRVETIYGVTFLALSSGVMCWTEAPLTL